MPSAKRGSLRPGRQPALAVPLGSRGHGKHTRLTDNLDHIWAPPLTKLVTLANSFMSDPLPGLLGRAGASLGGSAAHAVRSPPPLRVLVTVDHGSPTYTHFCFVFTYFLHWILLLDFVKNSLIQISSQSGIIEQLATQAPESDSSRHQGGSFAPQFLHLQNGCGDNNCPIGVTERIQQHDVWVRHATSWCVCARTGSDGPAPSTGTSHTKQKPQSKKAEWLFL